ncbi:MAG TPA: SDR family NAD(P)-dependent oxidoreductase [Pseudomonadales bacterium]|nr:glucose 1-dehydrogenase [Gammaproteobacteria bacterium]MDP6027949.1 SDR family NAD(P)-dependent oxidoreductase [Pseudomonadales bacterium]MDP7314666.1 SDR family NAD(P)-dependent oxidoreductase [Pseudomonadales bacterium]HJP50442.1 SDR family NAD(P)-dependent oxidoreductase [Pseudomonadales bacterium]
MKTAVVIGVGPQEGVGGYLCEYAAKEGLHVIIAGRTQEKLDTVAASIKSSGGHATGIICDATVESEIIDLISKTETIGEIDLAIYNAGNNFNGDFLTMEADLFEKAWRVCTLGGFLFARESLKAMRPRERGTLIFTGASASMRGKPMFAPFTAAKAGLRAMAQSLAREFQPRGIHVGHVVIDGGIAGDKIIKGVPQFAERVGEDGLISLDGIAQAFMYLYKQPRTAWTHEIDLRTYKENF